jgi:hypothetical protein
MQVRFDVYTKNLTSQDNLTTSDYYKYIIFESLLALPHPNIILNDFSFTFQYTGSNNIEIITYQVNEIFLFLMLFRIYFIVKFSLTLTYYMTSRAARTCKLYGERSTYAFAIRCVFNKSPFLSVILFLILSLIFFSSSIRLFERAFNSFRSSYIGDSSSSSNFDSYFNSLWFTFHSMITINYGVTEAKSPLGRIILCLCVLTGVLIVSLVTVSFFKSLELNQAENKSFILLQRMILRNKHDKYQINMVETMLYHNFLKFKLRKMREEDLEVIADLTPLEVKKRNKLIEEITEKKSKCELRMKHLIRDKTKVAK